VITCCIGAIHLKAIGLAPVIFEEVKIMERSLYIQQFRIELYASLLA